MAATAATTPGSLDSDAPSFSDDPAAMSQSSLTSATSDEDDESLMSTPKRYPAHLSHGSAPRRRQWANSSQYESMEELLTAAGYTVTRVFTPETERVQKLAEHQEEGEARKTADEGARSPSGIGRLVTGLIAHILPAGGSTATRRETPQIRVELVDDSESNPFLESGSPTRTASACAYPQAAQSLRTHLLSTHAVSRPNSGPRPRQPLHPNHRAQPALRHTNSAPSLPRITSARRRALPSAWRDAAPSSTKPMWSGGFVPKTVETQLKPCAGPSWFGSVRSSAGHEARPQTSPAATIRPRNLLKPPSLHRARSAPRSTCVHVPLPAPSARPSPVVQQNTVVCRSQSSLAIPPRARSESRGRHHAEESPILAPEPGSTAAEGLPPTPARPTLHRARSNGFLRRPAAVHAPHPSVADDEPDLASIVSAFRSSSPSRRQRSIRSLRALLKDPRFPDVPVVCVASPGTVGTGGPGRAVWMTGPGWEAEVRRKNVLGARG